MIEPGATRLLGYADYRAWFMPLAREMARDAIASGKYNLRPGDEDQAVRFFAKSFAHKAENLPAQAAAEAIAFFARRMAEQDQEQTREAAE